MATIFAFRDTSVFRQPREWVLPIGCAAVWLDVVTPLFRLESARGWDRLLTLVVVELSLACAALAVARSRATRLAIGITALFALAQFEFSGLAPGSLSAVGTLYASPLVCIAAWVALHFQARSRWIRIATWLCFFGCGAAVLWFFAQSASGCWGISYRLRFAQNGGWAVIFASIWAVKVWQLVGPARPEPAAGGDVRTSTSMSSP